MDPEAWAEGGSPADALDGVVGDIVNKAGGHPQSLSEHVQAMLAAVDWSEPWIRAVLGFHAALFLVAVAGRKRWGIQMAVLTLCSACAPAPPPPRPARAPRG